MNLFGRKIKGVNKRHENRYSLPNLSAYTDEGADAREKLINVSLNGCCLSTTVNVNEGEHILIHFIASADCHSIDESYCMDGQVVWRNLEKDGSHVYGVRFTEPRSPFFISETQAFKEEVSRLACRQYLQ